MKKWMALALVASLPAQGFAGANPLISPRGSPAPASSGKTQNLFKNDEQSKLICDELGRSPKPDQPCMSPDPMLMPRDGVSDEMLQKYKIRKD